mmetsp:Transcript_49207/g.107102  ORF Transcript_49207/g.107102 Transcript_49207/m.107102 type:complete len:354 (+) Transcript_49207:240-1301(+)
MPGPARRLDAALGLLRQALQVLVTLPATFRLFFFLSLPFLLGFSTFRLTFLICVCAFGASLAALAAMPPVHLTQTMASVCFSFAASACVRRTTTTTTETSPSALFDCTSRLLGEAMFLLHQEQFSVQATGSRLLPRSLRLDALAFHLFLLLPSHAALLLGKAAEIFGQALTPLLVLATLSFLPRLLLHHCALTLRLQAQPFGFQAPLFGGHLAPLPFDGPNLVRLLPRELQLLLDRGTSASQQGRRLAFALLFDGRRRDSLQRRRRFLLLQRGRDHPNLHRHTALRFPASPRLAAGLAGLPWGGRRWRHHRGLDRVSGTLSGPRTWHATALWRVEVSKFARRPWKRIRRKDRH